MAAHPYRSPLFLILFQRPHSEPETARVCNCVFSMGLLSSRFHCVYVCMYVDVHVLALSWPHFEPISMIALSPSVHLLIQ